jgi:hypothetical protein
MPPTYLASIGEPGDTTEATGRSNGVDVSAEGTYLYGRASGYVQTPTGGNPGTTSRHRPRLGEIGIDDANVADARVIGGWGPHEVYAGGQWVRLSGSDVLGTDLVSQGHTFPAGTAVRSELTLDWYRIGYRYKFEWDDPDAGRPLFTLAPSIGADLLDFHYRLVGGGERADRSYLKGGLQFGAEGAWNVTDRFSVVAEILCSAPIPNTPFILKGEIDARYRILTRERLDAAALLGVAYERIEYEDNQTVPNHVQVDLGPMLVAGLEFRF